VAAEIAAANQVRRAAGVSTTSAGSCVDSLLPLACIRPSDSSLGYLVTNH